METRAIYLREEADKRNMMKVNSVMNSIWKPDQRFLLTLFNDT